MDLGAVAGEVGLFALGGDPDAIRSSGGGWSAFGLRAEGAAVAVRAVAAVGSAEFVADEGMLFADRLRGELAAGLTAVADAWGRVGRALTAYAGELADCQAELARLAASAGSEQSLVSARSADLGRARPADAAALAGLLVEAQCAVAAVRRRAVEVRARHGRAIEVCCKAIGAARLLAPTSPAGVRGTAGAGRYVVASVGIGSPMVSIGRGLTVASASSAVFASRVGVAVQGARFGVTRDGSDAEDGTGGVGRLPSPQRLQIIRDKLLGACMFEYSQSLDPVELGDLHAACVGFADSAVSDPRRLAAALQLYPAAGDPTPEQRSAWSAIAEGFGLFAETMATIAGVGDCLEGDAAGCAMGVVGILPLGRLARLGVGAADAARGAERLTQATANGTDDADPTGSADPSKTGETQDEVVLGQPTDGSAGSKLPTSITGMTRHGEDQAMGRDGGVGVSDEAMANAVANPRVPPVVQSNGGIRYEGEYATVILNQEGKVITTWAINKRGWRVK